MKTTVFGREAKIDVHRASVIPFTVATCLVGAFVAPLFAADPITKEHASVIVVPSEMQWTDSSALPAGVKVSVLYGDLKKAEPFGFRLKIPAGAVIAPHTHPVNERVTVVSGSFAMGEGEKFSQEALKDMPVGSIAIFPKGCPMFALAKEEAVVQVNGEGPWGITYINPEDDPRNKK
ncbi:MAG TPA: cupin domain-containing protein [Chthoniobacterales bacterium]